jgi:hypothetical protein
MKVKIITVLIFIVLVGISFGVSAHDCKVGKGEMSMHFKGLSLFKTSHIIAGFSDKNLLIKIKSDIEIPLHYNSEHWQSNIKDLDKKYDIFSIQVKDDTIVLEG